ncbi:hypothetical protein BH09PSE4_BH09PSE4_22500 [soil metagenome]
MTKRAAPDPIAAGDNVVSIAAALDAPMDAPTMAKPGDQAPFGGRDDGDEIDRPVLPAGCPVKPLGLGIDGQTCWYLNVLGQLVALGPRDHGKNNLHALFSPRTNLLSQYWPQWSEPKFEGRGESKVLVKKSEIVGFKQDKASECLISSCGMQGIFDAHGRVRGRGAHKGAAGGLIVHTGDQVMVTSKSLMGIVSCDWQPTGLIDGHVYPAAAPTPRPHHEKVGAEAVEPLLSLISTWNWRRGDLDAMLAFGWIAQTSISGALAWRSHLFVTGGQSTGKSSFNGKDGLCDRLLGSAVMRTGGATEAAVRQRLREQTIPVIFDEFEPNQFNAHKLSAVSELARLASSGTNMDKGSSDHKAATFVLNSCFQFSAILTPQMEPQDRSRFAILELEPFPTRGDGEPAAPKLNLEAAKLPALGAALMRRMFDGWWRWTDTYGAYHDALTARGHTARSADTFGTLLACADLALYDTMPTQALLDAWATKCAPEALAEISDTLADHEDCLNFLKTTMVQARGSDAREGLGTWIARAVNDAGTDGGNPRDKLGEYGLKVVNARPKDRGPDGRMRYGASEHVAGQPCYLAIAQKHRALAEIFGPSKWQGGGWAQTLARSPAAIRGVKAKFAHASLTAVLVPIELVLDRDEVNSFIPCKPDLCE